MKRWLRRIRGAIGMGLTWAVAWFGAGVILLLVVGFGAADVPFPLGFGMLGFFAGVAFSVVLGLMERRRTFEQMSLPRFAVWGGVGGLLLSGIFVFLAGLGGETLLILSPVFALSGAVCGTGSLALARMAEDRKSLDAYGDKGDAGLTEDEARELLKGRSCLSVWIQSEVREGPLATVLSPTADHRTSSRTAV